MATKLIIEHAPNDFDIYVNGEYVGSAKTADEAASKAHARILQLVKYRDLHEV